MPIGGWKKERVKLPWMGIFSTPTTETVEKLTSAMGNASLFSLLLKHRLCCSIFQLLTLAGGLNAQVNFAAALVAKESVVEVFRRLLCTSPQVTRTMCNMPPALEEVAMHFPESEIERLRMTFESSAIPQTDESEAFQRHQRRRIQ